MFNPTIILSAFIAAVLGFLVAPHLSLVSRTGAFAMKLAAGALALGVAFTFAGPMLVQELRRFELPVEPYALINAIITTAFWACLAWSVLGVVQTAKPKGFL